MGENISSVKETDSTNIINKKSRKITTVDTVIIALCAAIISVCAWISIPAAIPFTLQTFAVFTVSAIFGAKRGTLSVAVYILLGAVGVPVFAKFTGGIGILLGNTGGYTIGFIFIALIVGTVSDKFDRKTLPLVISMIIGLLMCYIFGTAWFAVLYTHRTGMVGLGTVAGSCVLPFVIPDCIKILCAVLISRRIKRSIKF